MVIVSVVETIETARGNRNVQRTSHDAHRHQEFVGQDVRRVQTDHAVDYFRDGERQGNRDVTKNGYFFSLLHFGMKPPPVAEATPRLTDMGGATVNSCYNRDHFVPPDM